MARIALRSPTKAYSARRAGAAFEKLQALTFDSSERDELAASGVAEHRVEALYPSNYAARVPAICQLLGRHSEDETLDISEAISQAGLLCEPFFKAPSTNFYELTREFFTASEFDMLQQAVAEHFSLPKNQLAVVMAYAYWMMEHAHALEDLNEQSVHEFFYQLYSYLIPELAQG